MYFIIKAVVLFLAMMLSGTFVSAQFFSFHQAPQSYIDGKGQAVSYTGFRNQFEPIGTPGCVMGVVSLRGACTYVSGGLSFSLSGAQNSTQFKVYVPAGVTSFIFSGYLPQGMQAAVAVRMGSAPTRTNPLSATEYANYQAARNLSTVYQRLSAGDEVIMVADGGGSFSLAGNNNFSTPLAKGAWLYFRLINGDYIDTPRATYEIDLSSYIAGYNAITTANGWGGDGDPVDTGSAGTSTGTNTNTNTNTNTLPATTTISFSKDSLVSTDTDTDTKIGTLVVVSPSSSSASLPACNATQKTPSGASVASSFIHWADSPTNSKFSLAAGAAVVTQAQTITITCGTATKDFTIRLPLTVTQSVDANGILTLSFPFNVGTSGASDLYVLAYVPDIIVKSFGSVKDDLYVYQVTGDTWKPILFADPEVKQTVTSGSTVFINTGLPKTLLQGLNVYIYAAYLPSGNKDFSALKFIGDATAPTKLPSSTPLWQPK